MKNAGYNGDIAPGSTVSFQYNLTDVEADFPNTFQFVQTRQLCAESDFVASLSISYLSQWDTSFYGSITLSNLTDRPVEAWEFDFDCNFVITASNSADIKLIKTPTGYRIKGSYNKILSANSTVMLSFTGKNPGGNFTPIIDNFVLSGARVRVEVDEEIKNNTLDDLKVLNEEAYYPLEIDCRADGEICSIDGKYSDILVTDDKSALKSLYSIQNLIGFDNPGDEFIIDRIGSYDTYTSYHFNQIYNNVKVYGSSTTVIVRNNGEILSMGTDYRNISGIETTPVLTEDNIIDIFDIDKAELYIWNFGEYENIPILVYVFNKDSEFLVISAIDGSIIESSSNILGYENYDVQGDGFEGFDLRDKLSKIELDNDIKIENRNDEFWVYQGSDYPIFVKNLYTKVVKFVNGEWIIDIDPEYVKNGPDTPDDKYKACIYGKNYDAYLWMFEHEPIIAYTIKDDNKTTVYSANDGRELESWENEAEYYEKIREILEQRFGTIYDAKTDSEYLRTYIWKLSERPLIVYAEEKNGQTRIISAENLKVVADWNVLGYDKYLIPLLESGGDWGVGLSEGKYVPVNVLNNDTGKYELMYINSFPLIKYFPVEDKGNGNYQIGINNERAKIDIKSSDNTISKEIISDSENTILIEFGCNVGPYINSYVNALYIYDWYNENLKFNWVKDNGKHYDNLSVFVDSSPYIAEYDSGEITVDKTGKTYLGGLSYNYSSAGSLENMAHEFTHGVFEAFCTGSATSNIARGINEGYADLFAHLIDGNWLAFEELIGNESFKYYRNATMPPKKENLELGNDFYVNPNSVYFEKNYEYNIVPFINHPAYLMNQQGISVKELSQLYYTSLDMGNVSSKMTLNNVRANLIKAAKEQNYSTADIEMMRNTFNSVGVPGNPLNLNTEADEGLIKVCITNAEDIGLDKLKIILTNLDGTPIVIGIDNKGQPIIRNEVMTNNAVEFLPPSRYKLSITASGYVSYIKEVDITVDKDFILNIKLAKEGTGTWHGTIVDFLRNTKIPGVKVVLVDDLTGNPIVEDASGKFVIGNSSDTPKEFITDANGSFEVDLPAGYYNSRLYKNGYWTRYFAMATLSGGESIRYEYWYHIENTGVIDVELYVHDSYPDSELWNLKPTLVGKLDGNEIFVDTVHREEYQNGERVMLYYTYGSEPPIIIYDAPSEWQYTFELPLTDWQIERVTQYNAEIRVTFKHQWYYIDNDDNIQIARIEKQFYIDKAWVLEYDNSIIATIVYDADSDNVEVIFNEVNSNSEAA